MSKSRRNFMRAAGNALGAAALVGAAGRILSPPAEDAEFIPQNRRFAWQIDPDKCQYCGKCETACVRKPSAAKAVNDPVKCSNCVVCYGHISSLDTESEKIDSEGVRVCPVDAVTRQNFSGGADGTFLYGHDHGKCVGCAQCVQRCNEHGNASMFMVIRPDLCLGCNECAIAVACEHAAIERVPLAAADELRGAFGLEDDAWMGEEW